MLINSEKLSVLVARSFKTLLVKVKQRSTYKYLATLIRFVVVGCCNGPAFLTPVCLYSDYLTKKNEPVSTQWGMYFTGRLFRQITESWLIL